MNKKEVLEIRKQFTPANCAITRICGCYVNHEKEKICQTKQAFLSMPEEEAFKYFDIFKHTFSGTVGKNMINMEFFDHVFENIGHYEKDEVLIIGDSLTSDMQGGNNAGIICCWYNPNHLENTKGIKIDHEIDNLWQLEEILKTYE